MSKDKAARSCWVIVTRTVNGDFIHLDSIEPNTTDGKATLVKQINRPAGQRVAQARVVLT